MPFACWWPQRASWGCFAAFGGRIAPGKVDLLICAAVLGLLYTQYFTLFTMMGGATPGMMFAGLRVVSYEGKTPDPGRLIWRSVGYAISGATALLGYLWAFWDQDHLTWHDRISQTYVARAESLFETRPARGTGDWFRTRTFSGKYRAISPSHPERIQLFRMGASSTPRVRIGISSGTTLQNCSVLEFLATCSI